MSQKVTRKSTGPDEKEKRQADSPVKEMKKKMAANAEKEKHAAEKNSEKTDKPEKGAEKVAEKPTEKKVEKNGGVADKSEKKTENKQGEKKDNHTEKRDNHTEKKDNHAEKKDNAEKKEDLKGEKSGKSEAKKEKPKPAAKPQNGVHTNGADDANGTVSDGDDDGMLVIDDDDVFPELTYDDTSDAEGFELPTPDPSSRSLTRRSQVKATRTPETPRPASDKLADKLAELDGTPVDPKDTKVLKLKDDATSTDRKLRSADSPKPETKAQDKQETKKDTPKKDQKEDGKENAEKSEKHHEVEVIIEIDNEDDSETQPSRKTDTNYSKSRVKVSPYRRSGRLADQTTSSVMANYTGNNTTMEMDITESSVVSEEASMDDSSFLNGLRNIRGRRSYKLLKDMPLKHTVNRSVRNISVSEASSRPTGTVVGRKRKPESEDPIEVGADAAALEEPAEGGAPAGPGKRMRLLDRIAQPFRRTLGATTPLVLRRPAEIVGINTDLPQSAPVAADTFDPEALKEAPAAPAAATSGPTATNGDGPDTKRCVLM